MKRNDGISMVEYALLAAIIAGASAVAVGLVGDETRSVFSRLSGDTTGQQPDGTTPPGGGSTPGGGGAPGGGGTQPPGQQPTVQPGDNFAILIGSDPLPPMVVGQFFSFDFKSLVALVDAGSVTSADLSYAVASGSLPDGLSLSPDGILSGTPEVHGPFTFEVSASFATSAAARPTAGSVAAQSVAAFLPETWLPANVDLAALYDNRPDTGQNIQGGIGFELIFPTFVRVNGFQVAAPPGVGFAVQVWNGTSFVTIGTGSGASGTVALSQDWTSNHFRLLPSGVGAWTFSTFRLGYDGVFAAAPMVELQPVVRPTVDAFFSHQLTAADTVGTQTWTLVSGSLPPGVTLSPTGLVSGIPSQIGFFTANVAVNDIRGVRSVPRELRIEVQTTLLASGVLPSGPVNIERGALYDDRPDTTIILSSFGAELQFSQPVRINSVQAVGPSQASFVLEVWNGGSFVPIGTGSGASGIIALPHDSTSTRFRVVLVGLDFYSFSTFRLGYNGIFPSSPSVSATTLATSAGTPVTWTLSGQNIGLDPVWSIVSGSLPNGLSLLPNGTIEGVPTQTGTFTPSVTVNDARGVRAVPRQITITIN